MNFDFTENYVLENERILLRPLLSSDIENLLLFAINEPDLWQYSLVQAIGREGLEKYIATAIANRNAEKEYAFIVYDKIVNAYAGSTRFYDFQLLQKNVQLGYTWYGKKFQGTGINSHCKFLMFQFAFEKLGIERIELRADFDNKKSICAMQKIGCTAEGVLRQNGYKPDGTRRDSIVFSILRNEWDCTIKNRLLSQ